MTGNLRDRLKRIQLMKQGRGEAVSSGPDTDNRNKAGFTAPGWIPAGHLTLKREISGGKSLIFPKIMPEAAGIVVPGLDGTVSYEDLLFFDLETTGLSGGAGTMAFLGAFGRLVPLAAGGQKRAVCDLFITQYLLLDYPGENDFINALLGEFERRKNTVVATFNGKSFDSQILKTRCLMNGIIPPEYRHADLLYPARRLWKRLLPDCSQGTIETNVLSIDRTGDIPGAMAPDIWFAFLKNGEAEPLLGICEHNRRDIAGLAAIFAAMIRIAGDPLVAAKKINFDLEALSLRWYEMTHSRNEKFRQFGDTGKKLLRHTAETACPLCELQYGLVLLRTRKYDEGRKWLYRSASEDRPLPVRITAFRALAIDSEHRLKDPGSALDSAKRGMALLPPDSPRKKEFERRVERLTNEK